MSILADIVSDSHAEIWNTVILFPYFSSNDEYNLNSDLWLLYYSKVGHF